MSELPQKLRAHSNAFNAMSNADWMEIADASLKDAAARIEQLEEELLQRDAVWLPAKDAEFEQARARIEQLEAALRKYTCGCSGRKCDPDRYPCGEDARAALEGK